MTKGKWIFVWMVVGLIALLEIPERIDIFHTKYIAPPEVPAVIHSITPRSDQVCQGSMLLYDVDFEKRTDRGGKVKRQLVNSYMIDYDPVEPPRKPLGRYPVTGYLHVPKSAEVGDWFIRMTIEYEIPSKSNPKNWESYAVTKESSRFWVVSCPDPFFRTGPNRGGGE